MICDVEIVGIRSLSINTNNGITITRPNILVENEVNVTYTTTVLTTTDSPTWQRVTSYSDNYVKKFKDTFKFYLQGISSTERTIIETLRTGRRGFLVQATFNSGDVVLYPSPVFVSSITQKKDDMRSWEIEMSYNIPTFNDKLKVV